MSATRFIMALVAASFPLLAQARPALTLAAAQARLLAVAPSLVAGHERIVARKAKARYKTALPDPTLSFGPQNLDVADPALAHDSMSAFVVGISQRFPPFGKLGLRRQGLKALVHAARFDLGDARARLVAVLTRNFCAYYYGRQALGALRRNRVLYREIAHSARLNYENGHGSLAHLLQARSAVAGVGDAILKLKAILATTKATLQELLILRRVRIAHTPPRLPQPPPPAVLLAHIERVPAFMASTQKVRAARYFLRAARRDLLPHYAIGASYGFRTAPEYPGGPRSPNQFSVEMSVSLPIFPGGRADQRIDRRAADLAIAHDRENATRLALRAAVNAAYAAYKGADARLRLLKTERLPEAQAALNAALMAFANGRVSLLQTLRYAQSVRALELTAWRLRSRRSDAIATLDYLGTDTENAHAH